MLSNVLAKIESAPRKALAAFLILFAAALLALLVTTAGNTVPAAVLHVANHSYRLEVADTPAERQKGLGGRQSLPASQGMLFVFDTEEQQCFWMKDMHIPIDIIWLNANKQVVYVERNVSPDTYPQTYCPADAAKYVIELAAGQAQAAGIKQGSALRF